ncbi:MAG: Hpt domain-containing protein [Parasphingorhabdus sp.]|uniref:Hpt domain-containing protein n=1 Tax=Parasphingorhabdus sp. TaxID=2709688 RepID=UPI003266915B
MAPLEIELIDWTVCTETRSALGPNFVRILGYFREDGADSIEKIENAMRAKNPIAMVDAAHKLKGEALQFGAMRLSATTEIIETTARACVEHHETPDDVIELVVALRSMFEETLAILEEDVSPVVQQRHPQGFGRRFG